MRKEMIESIFDEIRTERQRQDKKFGVQNYRIAPLGYDFEKIKKVLINTRTEGQKLGENDNWFRILFEEVLEVFAETGLEKQREEMIQVAAVAVAIIECMYRKGAKNEL